MRKYVTEWAAIHELCYRMKAHPRGKIYRTGKLENNLSDLSIITRELIVRLQSLSFVVFFVAYSNWEEKEEFERNHPLYIPPSSRSISFSIPASSTSGPHLEVKIKTDSPAPTKNKKVRARGRLVNIHKLTTPDRVIYHLNKNLLGVVQIRLMSRGISAFLSTELIQVGKNINPSIDCPMNWEKEEKPNPNIALNQFDKAYSS